MKKAPAMILAAGLGKRMREHNDQLPKPLVPVAGKPLLAYSLDLIRNAGFSSVVVNTHYKAEMVEEWLASYTGGLAPPTPSAPLAASRLASLGKESVSCYPELVAIISHEPELLETGGGVRSALPMLAETFFVINSDVINLEKVSLIPLPPAGGVRGGCGDASTASDSSAPHPHPSPPPQAGEGADKSSLLQTMQSLWDDARMDALLLLIPVEKAIGYRGAGDFCLAEDGRLLPCPLEERTEQGEARSMGESDLSSVALAKEEARGSIPPTKYVFTGVQLLHQRFLSNAPAEAAFSLSPLYRAALNAEPCRIFGMIHPGTWLHVGDGEGVREAEEFLTRF